MAQLRIAWTIRYQHPGHLPLRRTHRRSAFGIVNKLEIRRQENDILGRKSFLLRAESCKELQSNCNILDNQGGFLNQ